MAGRCVNTEKATCWLFRRTTVSELVSCKRIDCHSIMTFFLEFLNGSKALPVHRKSSRSWIHRVGVSYRPSVCLSTITPEQVRHWKARPRHNGLTLLVRTTVPFTETNLPNSPARRFLSGVVVFRFVRRARTYGTLELIVLLWEKSSSSCSPDSLLFLSTITYSENTLILNQPLKKQDAPFFDWSICEKSMKLYCEFYLMHCKTHCSQGVWRVLIKIISNLWPDFQ